ncbi:unnamed protein product [Taenia asiatica]|uniref:REJ domain-containing protein n=1 Tax=Taenia asiatica TaxID=60517 RepID=A0A0R3W2P6_TAEAS|nr:unnamed protein product [Taenia asiatica]
MLLTFRLCLPSGDTGSGFLRLRGPRSGGRFLTGGSIQIIGVDSADANVHLPLANLTIFAKNGIETVMALDHISVSSPSRPSVCNRLDIIAVVVTPPIDELKSSNETVLEATVVVAASEVRSVRIPFKIVKSSASPSYDPILLDNSNISALIPGVYSQLTIEMYYPKVGPVYPHSVQILSILLRLPKGRNMTVSANVTCSSFYESLYPSQVEFFTTEGVTIKPTSKPKLTFAPLRTEITQEGIFQTHRIGYLTWLLYLVFSDNGPDVINLTFSVAADNQRAFREVSLRFDKTLQPSGDPYDLKLSIVHVEMREEVQRPLQSGETVLVLMEFRIPGKSSADHAPTISIVDSEYATLDCPYFESVGKSILWNEYAADCAATSVTGLPLLEHSYCLGPVICEDDTDNKDLSLRFAGSYEVDMSSRATQTLQLYFCLRPGTYLNNLSFEAFSEFTAGREEVITINHISFNRSVNIPGLQFPQSQEQVSIRKAGGQIFARKVCAGPAYNTGYSYKKKNGLPNVTDDCIGISVEFQLADSEEVRSGAVHPVFTRIFDGDQLLHNLKVSVNVIDQVSPNLNVDFHFTNVKRKERGIYLLDLKITIANDSTLECHDAAVWLIHGGLFNVTVVKVENITMQIDLVTLPSGNGVSLAEHGGVYFDSTGLISLSLRQNVSFKVKENLDVGVSGMLRCRTYDRSFRSKTQPYEQPTYFQALARLPIEVGDSIAPLSRLKLKLCQVRGCGNVKDLFYESGMDNFWTARADSRLDKSLTFYATSLETNVTLNNLPQHRGLRLIIKNAYYEHETLDIKMAFYGTYGLKMEGDFDPCDLPSMDNKERECDEAQSQRSYIAGVDFVVFCDRIPSYLADGESNSACFRAFDKSPRLWKYLGPGLAHVVSYIRSENIMIGISGVKESYLVSNDSGESWMSVDRGYFTYLRFYYETVPEIPIPLIKVPKVFEPSVTGEECTHFAFRNWHLAVCAVTTTDWPTVGPHMKNGSPAIRHSRAAPADMRVRGDKAQLAFWDKLFA